MYWHLNEGTFVICKGVIFIVAAVLGVLDEIGADGVIISREQRPGVGEAIGSEDRLAGWNRPTWIQIGINQHPQLEYIPHVKHGYNHSNINCGIG